MLFNSQYFILYFLPITVFLYFFANKINTKIGMVVLIISSIVFYSPFGIRNIVILLCSIIFNWIISSILFKTKKREMLIIGITINVLLLSVFKYTGTLLEYAGVENEKTILSFILPIGISFYTFQQISFLLYTYNNDAERPIFLEYLVFVLFFPKLLMGPLIEYGIFVDILRDNRTKTPNWDNIASGCCLFVTGLFKKVIVADICAGGVDWGFENYISATGSELILTMLLYTFQIYFDFSGYSDMAIGAARMLNIELPVNFRLPYKSVSIVEFWKRWHITLTEFLTRHIYYSLGGNRKGKKRTYLNIIAVFLISGLWHGTGLTFALWGLFHGALSVFERASSTGLNKIPKAIRWIGTFICVNVLWLLFRADNLAQWGYMIKGMIINSNGGLISRRMLDAMVLPWWIYDPNSHIIPMLKMLFVFIWIAGCLAISVLPGEDERKDSFSLRSAFVTAILLCVCFVFMGRESTYVYLGF